MSILQAVYILASGSAFFFVLNPYPLLEAGTAMVAVVVICVCTGTILFGAGRESTVTPKAVVATLVPCVLLAVFILNGAVDHSPESIHQTVVVKTFYGRSWTRVTVRSWRSGRTNEQLYLKTSLNFRLLPPFFHRGDPITVGIKPGALGMPWISSLSYKHFQLNRGWVP